MQFKNKNWKLNYRRFKVTEGLRQDCSLSPTVFKVYLERVLRNWKRKCQPMGIPTQNTYVCIFTQFYRWPGSIGTRL